MLLREGSKSREKSKIPNPPSSNLIFYPNICHEKCFFLQIKICLSIEAEYFKKILVKNHIKYLEASLTKLTELLDSQSLISAHLAIKSDTETTGSPLIKTIRLYNSNYICQTITKYSLANNKQVKFVE